MVSNDVEAAPGGGVYALLLTPKARVIADLELFNTGDELVLAGAVRAPRRGAGHARARSRFRRKVELEPSGHAVVWGDADGALATLDDADRPPPAGRASRPAAIAATRRPGRWRGSRPASPRFGREFDGDTMPAEAGLDERAVSFTQGLLPGAGAGRPAALPRPCRTAACAGSVLAGEAPPAGRGATSSPASARSAG